ncbi:MAG: peptidoglycan-associated lipoprotein Pal [Candidatus Eisenbacteria bacterium]
MSMNSTALRSTLVVLPLFAVLIFAGCSKNKEVAEAAPPPPSTSSDAPAPTPAPPPGDEPAATASESTVQDRLKDIYYDYDSANLSAEAQSTLDSDGKVLMDNPTVNVSIEGHCDERGTVEYNLSLGDRRAQAARDYLVRYGVPTSRLSTVSYGEERPFSTGQDEASFGQNRRAHLAVR